MVNPSVIAAFTMITTVSAILFMFVWTIILCSYRCTVESARICTSLPGTRRLGQSDVLGFAWRSLPSYWCC
ncbi:hypothetical protein ACLK2H_23655 [Escherichia coli]